MSSSEHLETLSGIARALLADEPLPARLGRSLALLRTTIPFECARLIILGGSPWSYVLPAHTSWHTAPPWPPRLTSEALRLRRCVAHELGTTASYFAWPITWANELFGIFEVRLSDGRRYELSLIEACLPLLAASLATPSRTRAIAASLAEDDTARIEALRRPLEEPLLLQPLIQLVLDWVMHNMPASHTSLHLRRWDGDESRILTFALPPPGEEDGTISLRSNGATQLARRTLDATHPLWRRNGHGLEAALPLASDGATFGALVVIGPDLRVEHLRLLARMVPLIVPALRRAEFYHHLVEARTHLQQVFDGLPTGLALLDSDGRLLRANPSWPRLWSLPPDFVQPQQLVPWDMFEPLLERLPDPLAFDAFFRRWGSEPRETVFTLQHPHQELHVLLVPVHDSLGLRPSYLLAVNDVTRERELDRLKTEFVSVVSHELRTPLTSILGYTELLQAREFPKHERRELVDTVWKQATHLSNLVEDLLNVSRIDAGHITLTRWVLSLGQLVKELTAQLNKELDQSRHRLLLDVSDRLPPVYADRDRLRQILGNLLSNAIKYSPEGGEIVLHADVLRVPPPGAPPLPPEPAMLITVQDPGIGIPPQELGRIFERFYRVDNSNTRKIGGTGLGLAITRALVELHGGRIWVESVPGEGSTFSLTLPLATEVLRKQS